MTTTRTMAASAAEFIGRLESLARREDRGALAALRRGLGKPPGTVAEMAPYVEPAFDGAPGEAYIVGSLFGLHPHHRRAEGKARRGFGTDLRPLRGNPGEVDPGVERRFTALLDAHREAVPEHLRHLITLLRSRKAEAPIDYLQLFWDLRDWDDPDRQVQKRWASGFWGWTPADEGSASPDRTDDSTSNDDA
jgi:CRISPR system Cascade subunit CasB